MEIPPGAVHNGWNAGDEPVEFEGTLEPLVDLDRAAQAIFAVLNASKGIPPDLFYMAHVAYRHRMTQFTAVVPGLVQRIMFPVVLFAGKLLGKYKGDSWPGAPETVTGAPRDDGTP